MSAFDEPKSTFAFFLISKNAINPNISFQEVKPMSVTTPLLSKYDEKSDLDTRAVEVNPVDYRMEDIRPKQVLRSTTFWSLWFTWICIIQPANFVLSYFKVRLCFFLSPGSSTCRTKISWHGNLTLAVLEWEQEC